ETLRRWAASGKVATLKRLEENDFIQLQTYTKPLEMTEGCQNLRKRPRSVMQESVQSTSKDSIGNAGGFLPFWNEYTLEESKKWWLPEKTVCVALDPNLWKLAEDLLSIVTVFVARHNGLRSAANRKRRKDTTQAIQKFQEGSNETSSRQETPYDIRDEAMNDLLKGYASNFAANRKNFKMKFRSKKDPQQSIAILSKHWGKSRGEFSFLHKMNSAESLPKQLEYDSRLVINRLGEFYLCIPEPLKIRAENQGPLFSENQEKGGSGVIALDPGVRTFMTGYDPSGMAIEWGKNDICRIYRLCYIYDRLQSKRDMNHGKRNKCK
ncbi:8680_t:CDS:2, partial [Racocetra fulgida]